MEGLDYVLSLSLDEALAPGRRLKFLLFVIGGLALFAGVLASGLLARLLARPLSSLVTFANSIASGDLEGRVPPSRLTELTMLGSAFNDMTESLSTSYQQLREKNVELEAAHSDLEDALLESRHTQAQLVQTAKLAAVGELAAGVAHELNNPLSAVLTYSVLIREELDEVPTEVSGELERTLRDLPRKLKLVERGAERCKSIADNLLTFGRKSSSQMTEVCLAEVIERTLELVSVQLRQRRVRRKKDVGPDLATVGHLGELQQVLTNLTINASQAMKEGGWLSIVAERVDENVVVEVSDTGAGISEEDRTKIFDPFFTTKPTGKGTGLGLSIAYGIIERHGGSIDVESELGKGTTFRIVLPAAKLAREAQVC